MLEKLFGHKKPQTNPSETLPTDYEIPSEPPSQASTRSILDRLDENFYGTNNNEIFFGNGGNDYLYGRGSFDVLNGGSGNDYLFGGLGDDVLDGGEGNDILEGSTGLDTLTGGKGKDIFHFRYKNKTIERRYNSIMDFNYKEDSIVLPTGFTKDDVKFSKESGTNFWILEAKNPLESFYVKINTSENHDIDLNKIRFKDTARLDETYNFKFSPLGIELQYKRVAGENKKINEREIRNYLEAFREKYQIRKEDMKDINLMVQVYLPNINKSEFKNIANKLAEKLAPYGFFKVESPVPADVVTRFNLDTELYTQAVRVAGKLWIIAPSDVKPEELQSQALMMNGMLNGNQQLLDSMNSVNFRIYSVAYDMKLPELHDNTVAIGESEGMPFIGGYASAGGDYTGTGDILTIRTNEKNSSNQNVNMVAHEFGHAMDNALGRINDQYDVAAEALFQEALAESKIAGSKWAKHNPDDPASYNRWPMDNRAEFMAKLISTLYNSDTDIAKDHDEFQKNFPKEYAFVKAYFGYNPNVRATPMGREY